MKKLPLKRLYFSIVLISSLLMASGALADIISGSFVTSHSSDVTVTQLTIAKPTATAGNLMLANIAVNGGTSAIVTAPAGWTQILRTDNDANISLISYRKIVGASEPSNYTWSIGKQTTAEGGITVYSGVDTANPVDASADNSGFGLIATTTTITTSAASSTIVTLFAIDVGKGNTAGSYFSPPLGMTEKYDASNTPFGPSTAQHEMTQDVAGSTGSKSSTIHGNKSRNWVSQTIALKMQPVSNIIFSDDFNRSNGLTGNGWTDITVGSGAVSGISNNQWFSECGQNGSGYTYRTDISPSSGIYIYSELSFSNAHASPFFIGNRAPSPYQLTPSGYMAKLDSRVNTIAVQDGNSALASGGYSYTPGHVYGLSVEYTEAPQNWMHVYLWDITNNEFKPASPTISWTNSSNNYTVISSGDGWEMGCAGTDTSSVVSVDYYEVGAGSY